METVPSAPTQRSLEADLKIAAYDQTALSERLGERQVGRASWLSVLLPEKKST